MSQFISVRLSTGCKGGIVILTMSPSYKRVVGIVNWLVRLFSH